MPPDYDEVRRTVRAEQHEFSQHAARKIIERDLSAVEVNEAILSGEVIEDYPNDKYGPSCLILGTTAAGKALHVQIAYPPRVKVITAYPPSSDEWEADNKTRKS